MTSPAEIYHFQHERVVDFRAMMKKFLSEQIRFYSEVHVCDYILEGATELKVAPFCSP